MHTLITGATGSGKSTTAYRMIDELRESPPKKFIPTHLFQVLHVGVGKASGSVEFNLETINAHKIDGVITFPTRY